MRASDRAALLVLLLVAALGGVARAQAPDTKARQLERQLNDAKARDKLLLQDRQALARELNQLQGETSTAATAIQSTESAVVALELRLAELELQQAQFEDTLANRRERLGQLVLAVERLARVPREALLLRDQAPLDAARTGRLLAYAVPAIDGEATQLRSEVAALTATRAALARERVLLARTRETLATERARLDELIERRKRLVANLDAERTALALRSERVGRDLGSVRELLEKLAAEKVAAERSRQAAIAASRPFTEARGRARVPVEGTLLQGWGAPGEGGQPQRGVTFTTAPSATIVAPWHGTIVYAGPFRGYGVILILESSDGYHWLISGLGRLDVALGQAVRSGEPIGLAMTGGRSNPVVYVELRRHGQPIDPGPWLTAPSGKVSG